MKQMAMVDVASRFSCYNVHSAEVYSKKGHFFRLIAVEGCLSGSAE